MFCVYQEDGPGYKLHVQVRDKERKHNQQTGTASLEFPFEHNEGALFWGKLFKPSLFYPLL